MCPIKYIGHNVEFAKALGDLVPEVVTATLTGRFRSRDTANRLKWRSTATLLDLFAAPYSTRCLKRHQGRLLSALRQGVRLDDIDLDFDGLYQPTVSVSR